MIMTAITTFFFWAFDFFHFFLVRSGRSCKSPIATSANQFARKLKILAMYEYKIRKYVNIV